MNKSHKFHRPDLEAADMQAASRQLHHDLSRILCPGSIILDVGANRGQFALEILEIVSDIKIYSFEPVPDAYEDLKLLSEQHRQIIPFQQAITMQKGEADFFVMASDVGSSLLEPLPNQPSQWLTLDQKISVETVRIDDFFQDHILGNNITLLKSDAQGSDLDVILSAGKFLNPQFIQSILIEVGFSNFYSDQQSYYDIFSTLENAGYRMAWMYPHRAHDEWLWWADVLFIPR
jgi:FkbM family methyltransferase